MRASGPALAAGFCNPAKSLRRGKAACVAGSSPLRPLLSHGVSDLAVDVRLYALVDPERAGGHALPGLAAQLAAGGATLFQLRDKHGATRAMVEGARAIKQSLAPFSIPLLINDRIDVALAAGAAGVHVGQDDMTVE